MTKEDVIKRKEEFLESIKDLPEEERKERINNFNKELDKLINQIEGSIKVYETEVKRELLNKDGELSKEEQISLGKSILGCSDNSNIQIIDLDEKFPNINAVYVCVKDRGGNAVIVNSNKEYLTATSAVNFERHVEEFKNGRRTNN